MTFLSEKQRKKLNKRAIKAIEAIERYEIECKKVYRENNKDYDKNANWSQIFNFTFLFTSNKKIGDKLIELIDSVESDLSE